MLAATAADTVRDVGTLAGALSAIGLLAFGLVKFARRIDQTLDDVRTHVIPHFRPATVEEIRAGDREPGDTIPERVAQVEGDLSTQTVALAEHLDTEMRESGVMNRRLSRIEKHFEITDPEEGN